MDKSAIEPAVDALVRLRAVQDFDPSEAIAFYFLTYAPSSPKFPARFRRILKAASTNSDCMAFDQYMACREQIAALRAKELRSRSQCEAK